MTACGNAMLPTEGIGAKCVKIGMAMAPPKKISDRKIAARCPDVPRDQVEC